MVLVDMPGYGFSYGEEGRVERVQTLVSESIVHLSASRSILLADRTLLRVSDPAVPPAQRVPPKGEH